MKYKFKNYKLLILLLFIIFGCEKSKDSFRSNQNIETKFVNPKEHIGIFHNDALMYVLKYTNEIPPPTETKAYVEQILNTKYPNTSLDSIPAFPNNFNNLDPYLWINNFSISEKLKSEIKSTFDLFQTANDLNEIISSISEKELVANTVFSGSELDMYYEHLSVAKHTAIFWYPENQGGLNGFQYINVKRLKSADEVNWWKVLAVDCIGGLMGGPIGYVGASAIAVIMQL